MMDWQKLLTDKRAVAARPTGGLTAEAIGRSPFERDVDRITFSAAFRRLAKKTQVHPLASNDHVHNRLTHSLEVSRVGRTLGFQVGETLANKGKLPAGIGAVDIAAIVQAAALGHDIGNPPFGHAGEEAIKHWFAGAQPRQVDGDSSSSTWGDLEYFEGNAQGFRVLTQTEHRLFSGGLGLTYATLGAFMKYPWTMEVNAKKFGCYQSEAHLLEGVASELGLIPLSGGNGWSRHPLAFLVEAADDICYAIIDLEDAVELRLIPFAKIEALLLSMVTDAQQTAYRADVRDVPEDAFRVRASFLRGRVFDAAISAAVAEFQAHEAAIMDGNGPKELVSASSTDAERSQLFRKLLDAKKLAKDEIFKDMKKIEIELGCFHVVSTLLDAFTVAGSECAAAFAKAGTGKPHPISWRSDLVLSLLGDHNPINTLITPSDIEGKWNFYHIHRRILDFISGMTDNYAKYVASQIAGAGHSGQQRP